VKDVRHNRGGRSGNGIAGIEGLLAGSANTPGLASLYSKADLEKLDRVVGAENDPTKRMKARFSEWYLGLARNSQAIRNLVMPHPEESLDLSGEADPSNQNRYSPVPGLLHKYEMGLVFAVKTCSAHCRYCYRVDLFSGKTQKETANIGRIQEYILQTNEMARKGAVREATGEPWMPMNEVLLSGGDPMLLTNKQLATYLVGLAEVGIQNIRIGTKELAFFPARFCDSFFQMLDAFHSEYPKVQLRFVHHISHPDELISPLTGETHDVTAEALHSLRKRSHWISLDNQAPIIRGVNDDPKALHILQKQLFRHGISAHYFFQCRMIEGHKFFAVPVEKTLKIFSESQVGLSGVEKKARLCMSTEQGKVEVIGTTNDRIIFRVHRHPEAGCLGSIVMAKRDSEALWITDYVEKGLITDDHDQVFVLDATGPSPYDAWSIKFPDGEVLTSQIRF